MLCRFSSSRIIIFCTFYRNDRNWIRRAQAHSHTHRGTPIPAQQRERHRENKTDGKQHPQRHIRLGSFGSLVSRLKCISISKKLYTQASQIRRRECRMVLLLLLLLLACCVVVTQPSSVSMLMLMSSVIFHWWFYGRHSLWLREKRRAEPLSERRRATATHW